MSCLLSCYTHLHALRINACKVVPVRLFYKDLKWLNLRCHAECCVEEATKGWLDLIAETPTEWDQRRYSSSR